MTHRASWLIADRPSSAIRSAQWGAAAILTALLVLFAAGQRAMAQTGSSQRLPGSITLGPRLLDYRIECVDPNACRVQCFQHGVKVIDRDNINKTTQMRMLASTGAGDEVIPRWIELRSADGNKAQTLLLSQDTSCDLKSLLISPNARP